MARVVIDATVTTRRSIEDAFAYVADISKHPEWSPKALRIDGLSGPVAKGTHYTSYGWIPGDKEHRNEVEVTELDSPTRMVLVSTEPDGGEFINTFELSSTGSGTSIKRTMDMPKPTGMLGLVFPLILAFVAKPGFNKGVTTLGAKLDAGS